MKILKAAVVRFVETATSKMMFYGDCLFQMIRQPLTCFLNLHFMLHKGIELISAFFCDHIIECYRGFKFFRSSVFVSVFFILDRRILLKCDFAP